MVFLVLIERLNEIASVTYTLTGDLLTFSIGQTYYDLAKQSNLSKLRDSLDDLDYYTRR